MIAGVDEAGRGPLAGPVVAAAVVLSPGAVPEGIADSKTLAPWRRRRSSRTGFHGQALGWALGLAAPAEIDRLNILEATLLAMRRALAGLAGTGGGARARPHRRESVPLRPAVSHSCRWSVAMPG